MDKLNSASRGLDRVGLIGFHMGGSKGLYAACKTDVFRCLVDFYGPLEQSAAEWTIGRSLLPLVRDLSCPIQFGGRGQYDRGVR